MKELIFEALPLEARNLIMLMIRMARRLPREDVARVAAMDYLERMGWIPSPLRSEEASATEYFRRFISADGLELVEAIHRDTPEHRAIRRWVPLLPTSVRELWMHDVDKFQPSGFEREYELADRRLEPGRVEYVYRELARR